MNVIATDIVPLSNRRSMGYRPYRQGQLIMGPSLGVGYFPLQVEEFQVGLLTGTAGDNRGCRTDLYQHHPGPISPVIDSVREFLLQKLKPVTVSVVEQIPEDLGSPFDLNAVSAQCNARVGPYLDRKSVV